MIAADEESAPLRLPWRDSRSLGRVLPALREMVRARNQMRLDGLRAEADRLRQQAEHEPWENVALEGSAIAARAVAVMRGTELHDGQLQAGLALAGGCAVQLLTGEGKTFAAIGPALVHSLAGRKVHLVSANSYLAERDSTWAGDVLRALGCSVGATLPGRPRAETALAYRAEVTFGAAQDFGFDYLRDHLFLPGESPVQAGREVAIVDEADAVLLDLARTPLVLSGAAPARTEALHRADQVVRQLSAADVAVDLARQRVELTDEGIARVEAVLGVANLFDLGPVDWPGLVRNALRAHLLLGLDRDYVVGPEGIGVVDELTGRVVPGRRWAEGLHQAVEVKERLAVSAERRAAGRTTVGGYFGSYRLLAGMSGTLEGAEAELAQVYGLPTVVLEPHRPVIRTDRPDATFPTEAAKFEAVAEDISRRHRIGQPVLAGTVSIAQSQGLSAALDARGIPHRVLTARNDHEEADIIAGAGQLGAVTVATQMAGRGVDIVLGGRGCTPEDHAEVAGLGGLMVWGVEHHPAQRLDSQLRGRAGRQGDPGETSFAVCPTDGLMELAAASSQPMGVAIRTGQARAEELDRELRRFSRASESVIDDLHERLYYRRRRAAQGGVHDWLGDALGVAAEALAKGHLAVPSPIRLPRWKTGQAARRVVAELVEHRRGTIGADLFDQVSALIFRHLAVVLWSDGLDALDGMVSMVQSTPGARPDHPRWQSMAVAAYRDFERRLNTSWVEQLLAFSLISESPPGPTAAPGPEPGIVPLGSVMTAAAGDAEEILMGLRDWTGWSYNRFVRQHWGNQASRSPDRPGGRSDR